MMKYLIILQNLFTILPWTFAQGSSGQNFCQASDASCTTESIGYSPFCVISALSTCELQPTYLTIEADMQRINDNLSKYMKNPKILPKKARHCYDLKVRNDVSGVRIVFPYPLQPHRAVQVLCDQETDGGGWTVFQKREHLPLREDFYRTWIEYVLGFGNLTGEFWLGLDTIHALTNNQLMELRVDLEDWERQPAYAKYGYFHITNSSDNYRLDIGGLSGTAGDGFISDFDQYNLKGMMFSTHDNDNDGNEGGNCALGTKGGWWYNKCHISNLNGLPIRGKVEGNDAHGMSWHNFKGTYYSLKSAEMMVRPSFKT